MVRFEPGKLVIEIATPEPFRAFLQLHYALHTACSFVVENSQKDETGLEALGILSHELGKALSEMDDQTKQQIESSLNQ